MLREFAARCAVREVPAPRPWRQLIEGLRASDGFWLLESALPSERLGRFSFAGAAPLALLRGRSGRLRVEPRRDLPGLPSLAASARLDDPFDALRAWLPRARPGPGAPELPFAGGAVGWFGYELGARLERVSVAALDDLALPDFAFVLVDRLVAFEHATGRLFVAALGFGADGAPARERAERAADVLGDRIARGEEDPFQAGPRRARARRAPATPPEPVRLVDAPTGMVLGAFFDEGAYAKAVLRVKEQILAGGVYQANLTHRLAVDAPVDAWRIYTELRRSNPAPFAAFFESDEVTVIGSSPERFLRVDPGGWAESRPIKGTRPRGATPAEDAQLRADLAASEKDRAENVMIVDLVRNDLGRVCATGSVEVPELFAIEPYATVFQMVSTVRGRLARGRDALDALRAAFPPGSMTGAPKIAAMELLARLEPVRRGAYAGTLGWLDARGGAELAVVIRTLFHRPGRAWLHVGGGVVLDSDPAAEWAETLAKARALLDAVVEADR
jgi:para-aminobenzoate synthetase component 1